MLSSQNVVVRDVAVVSKQDVDAVRRYLFEGDLNAAEMKCREGISKARSLRKVMEHEPIVRAAPEMVQLVELEDALTTLAIEIDVAKAHSRK